MPEAEFIPTDRSAAPPRPAIAFRTVRQLYARFPVQLRRRAALGAAHDRRQKRWMTTEEFNEAFALSQFLPGPNVINFSVVFGRASAALPAPRSRLPA